MLLTFQLTSTWWWERPRIVPVAIKIMRDLLSVLILKVRSFWSHHVSLQMTAAACCCCSVSLSPNLSSDQLLGSNPSCGWHELSQSDQIDPPSYHSQPFIHPYRHRCSLSPPLLTTVVHCNWPCKASDPEFEPLFYRFPHPKYQKERSRKLESIWKLQKKLVWWYRPKWLERLILELEQSWYHEV